MNAMIWLLAYLLLGFIGHFIGVHILRIPPNDSWRWELAVVLFWPIPIAVAVCRHPKWKRQ
jgi:hypothetical protein